MIRHITLRGHKMRLMRNSNDHAGQRLSSYKQLHVYEGIAPLPNSQLLHR